MIQVIRDVEKLLDKVDYSMMEKKKQSRQFLRNLYVTKDIKKGEIFTEENIKSTHPKYLNNILGKISDRDYGFGDRFE